MNEKATYAFSDDPQVRSLENDSILYSFIEYNLYTVKFTHFKSSIH